MPRSMRRMPPRPRSSLSLRKAKSKSWKNSWECSAARRNPANQDQSTPLRPRTRVNSRVLCVTWRRASRELDVFVVRASGRFRLPIHTNPLWRPTSLAGNRAQQVLADRADALKELDEKLVLNKNNQIFYTAHQKCQGVAGNVARCSLAITGAQFTAQTAPGPR